MFFITVCAMCFVPRVVILNSEVGRDSEFV